MCFGIRWPEEAGMARRSSVIRRWCCVMWCRGGGRGGMRGGVMGGGWVGWGVAGGGCWGVGGGGGWGGGRGGSFREGWGRGGGGRRGLKRHGVPAFGETKMVWTLRQPPFCARRWPGTDEHRPGAGRRHGHR